MHTGLRVWRLAWVGVSAGGGVEEGWSWGAYTRASVWFKGSRRARNNVLAMRRKIWCSGRVLGIGCG